MVHFQPYQSQKNGSTNMNQEKFNERICRIIWHDILQRSIKTLSWGVDFRNIEVIESGTEFHVQGFKIIGKVRIQYIEGSDLFKVTIIPDNDKKNPIIIEDVYIDMLVSVIDEYIEYSENYQKKVYKECGFTENNVAL